MNYALRRSNSPDCQAPRHWCCFPYDRASNPRRRSPDSTLRSPLSQGIPRANWSALDAEMIYRKVYAGWPMNVSVQAWRMTRRVEERLRKVQAAGIPNPSDGAFQSAIDSICLSCPDGHGIV